LEIEFSQRSVVRGDGGFRWENAYSVSQSMKANGVSFQQELCARKRLSNPIGTTAGTSLPGCGGVRVGQGFHAAFQFGILAGLHHGFGHGILVQLLLRCVTSTAVLYIIENGETKPLQMHAQLMIPSSDGTTE